MSFCKESCRRRVTCAVCQKTKLPRGRSAPMEMYGVDCSSECPGYYQDPKPGHLWPYESLTEGEVAYFNFEHGATE